MTADMNRKTALVTGAGSGIGRSIAMAFSEHGAQVIVADVSQKGAQETVDMIIEQGGSAVFMRCDVSQKEDVDVLIKNIIKDFGRLDYAVNNAGIHNQQGEALEDADEDLWDRIISVNLKGVFLCMKHEVRAMLRQKSGIIVNIASLSGLLGEPGAYAYTAAKHGVMGLTKTAAHDYAKSGIRINAVCPSGVETPSLVSAPREIRRKFIDQTPVGRLGKPEEIASAVLWLCSDMAGFVTGTGLVIDGGVSTV